MNDLGWLGLLVGGMITFAVLVVLWDRQFWRHDD